MKMLSEVWREAKKKEEKKEAQTGYKNSADRKRKYQTERKSVQEKKAKILGK